MEYKVGEMNVSMHETRTTNWHKVLVVWPSFHAHLLMLFLEENDGAHHSVIHSNCKIAETLNTDAPYQNHTHTDRNEVYYRDEKKIK